jgi:hypothetical protein
MVLPTLIYSSKIANAAKDKPLDVLTKAANRLLRAVKKHHSSLYKKLSKFPKLEGTKDIYV